MKNIFNASGKIIGWVDILEDSIIVHNNKRPELQIDNASEIIDLINNDDDKGIVLLYDKYTLTIGEIAALYGVYYAKMNKRSHNLKFETALKAGRRNSSYGKKFSEERVRHMVENRKDDHKQMVGRTIPKEQREKISQTLKQKYASGELVVNADKIRQRWKDGRYDNIDFGHGIGGHLFSIKNNKKMFFRSLLELKYYLYLEKNPEVKTYEYEPLRIDCDNGSIYTPDFKFNNIVVELKSKQYVEKMGGKILENFKYKKEQAEKYCKSHNLIYKVIFDEDIDFESNSMKRWLQNNPQIIEKFQIDFIAPQRVFGQ